MIQKVVYTFLACHGVYARHNNGFLQPPVFRLSFLRIAEESTRKLKRADFSRQFRSMSSPPTQC